MKLELLANRPDAIPIIGGWYHAQWGHRFRATLEDSIERLQDYQNTDRMPLMFVATDRDEILGTAQLKYREMKDIFPDLVHWLGGVYVAPEHRGKGTASRLAEAVAEKAKAFGVDTLYLQTERLDGGLYAKLGWVPFRKLRYHELDVAVMERTLAPP